MRQIGFIFFITLLACHNTPNKAEAAKITIPVEHIAPAKDQNDRRRQSEEFCQRHAIPVYANPNALFVDPDEKVVIREKDEVVDRIFALCYNGLKSEGLSDTILAELKKSWRINEKLTPNEKKYAFSSQPTDQQKTDANWKYEDMHVLLWALGFIDSLGYPDKLCQVVDDVKILHDLTESQFRQKARLRSKKELLDEADLILRLDWACVNARTKNQPAPGNLNGEVVMERHYALNWLIRYLNQDWDDVRTDT